MAKLSEYHRKRDFERTSEPEGDAAPAAEDGPPATGPRASTTTCASNGTACC